MIKLFEVVITLAETGGNLNLLIAEDTAGHAIAAAHRRLKDMGVNAEGERLGAWKYSKEETRADEVTVAYVVQPVAKAIRGRVLS